MTPGENYHNRGPVIIGYGTEKQSKALWESGAEKVWTPEDRDLIFADHVDLAFRKGDTLLMAQPNLVTPKELRKVVATGTQLQVIGHEPVKAPTNEQIAAFRKLKAKGEPVYVVENRGRKSSVEYTEAQAQAIVALWQTPELTPVQVQQRVSDMLGQDVSKYWARDLAKKRTGSAARSPESKT